MQISLFAADFVSGKGILRLARCLQRDWPGNKKIKLSAAQNLMSRCLGYVDLHDARKSIDKDDLQFVSLEEIKAQSLRVIDAMLNNTCPGQNIDYAALNDQIEKWPFKHLAIYKILDAPPPTEVCKKTIQSKAFELTTLYINNYDSVISRVQKALGHIPVETTNYYMKHAIGHCRNDLSPNRVEIPIETGECLTCGHSTISTPQKP
ncbi:MULTISPECIES: hypothetical protein [Pseudomonas]|uniref:Uncharacterized protein n=1 Tax=Pseudomonas juntendi TaxID=2666183 RepID=A0A7W2LWM5_9PSED|nr:MULTISPECIES: hypothetical protein [Pseudomonas]MBA6133062.1 hypothetical protein [Pseudomonas juntendi]MBA6148417.1 hypothetical protein [Pseudomonas juntendi]MCK2113466.1 hypothetical protein [Pseudomonas juntendi]MCK2118007.1 hypothetical protein [Pseudomonas juntendi]MDG9811674.1 hypothetical protein [Pseudomonas juntendi]